MNKFLTAVACSLVAVALVAAFISASNVPIVQVGDKDQCIGVLVIEQGKEISKPCSVVNLDTDRYDIEYVYGTPAEAAALQKEMAEQARLQRLARR